jgi:hypothetical protein
MDTSTLPQELSQPEAEQITASSTPPPEVEMLPPPQEDADALPPPSPVTPVPVGEEDVAPVKPVRNPLPLSHLGLYICMHV